jgi:adenine-specific DNA-methyltransferase
MNARPPRSSRTGETGVKPDQGSRLIDPVTQAEEQPDGPGVYLHWDGRRSYRTHMPAPRVLEPVERFSSGGGDGNRVIEGDNLQVMVSLRSQYRGAVDLAYLDPPYNTGKNDFRYSDRRFHDPNANDDDGIYVSNEDGGRHTKWLNYMGPRLWLVWELLADHGVCFVSINDVELFRLGMLMNEIFGERNRLGVLVWKQAVDNNPTRIAVEHEYILCYAKRMDSVPAAWQGSSPAKQWLLDKYVELQAQESNPTKLERLWQAAIRAQKRAYRQATAEGRSADEVDLGRMDRFRHITNDLGPWAKDWHLENPRPGGYNYNVLHPTTGKPCRKPPNGYRYSWESMQQLLTDDRIVFGKDDLETAQLRRYLRDSSDALRSVMVIPGRNGSDRLNELIPNGTRAFPHPKPVELMELILGAAGDLDALVLDPFAGSGTTGDAVMRLNAQDGGVRRFIMIEEGEPGDAYARSVLVPRLRAAIKQDRLQAGFDFFETGQRLNRDAILELEREAVSNLIVQTDATGVGRGIGKVAGHYIIGRNSRNEAIALCWNGRNRSTVDREVLKAMFEEAKDLQLNKPLRVYGTTCTVGETESFRFCQIPDEILAALQVAEEQAENEEQAFSSSLEVLEGAVQSGSLTTRTRP